MEKQTYTPNNSVIKQGDHVQRVIKAGQTFLPLTPLMADATNAETLIKWDGTAGKEVVLSACNAKALAANEVQAVIVSGIYRTSSINWPDGLTADQKMSAFQGTAISVSDE